MYYKNIEIYKYRNITQLKHLSDEELISQIVSSYNDFYNSGYNVEPTTFNPLEKGRINPLETNRFNPLGKKRFNKNDFKGQSRELLWSNYREFRKRELNFFNYLNSVPEQDHIETQEDQTSDFSEGMWGNLFGILLFPAIGIAICYYLMWGNAFGVGGGAVLAVVCGLCSIMAFVESVSEEETKKEKKLPRHTGLVFLFLFLCFTVTAIVSHSKICDSGEYDKAVICVGAEFRWK